MALSNLSIEIDEKDKENFEFFCEETGMNMSVAINIFIKMVLRENKLPFEIKGDPFYSETNMNYLNNIVSDIKQGKAKFVEHKLIDDE